MIRYHRTWCEIAVARPEDQRDESGSSGVYALSSRDVMKSFRGGSPHRFRWSVRGLMGAIVVIALWLAMLVLTAVGARVDWRNPRVDDLFVAGVLVVVETIGLYYSVLATVMVRGLMNPDERAGRVRKIFIYGPVLAAITLIAVSELLDALLRLFR